MTNTEQEKFYQMLGGLIKNARTQAGLKQEAFASYLNLSRTSIVNIEKGRQHPPIHLLWVIAKVLDIDATSLLPAFKPSDEKISIAWKRIIAQQVKGDKNSKDKLIGFIEELQSTKSMNDAK